MYTKEMLESIKKVEANRAANAALEPSRMTAEEKDDAAAGLSSRLQGRHGVRVHLPIGPNKGDKVPKELGAPVAGPQPYQGGADRPVPPGL